MILTIYIIICLIWGVFFTAYMFPVYQSWDSSLSTFIAGTVFFAINTIFAPISMWENIPYIYREFKN